jgi:hypothetical protein
MDTTFESVTVSLVEPLTEPSVALMVVAPATKALAMPWPAILATPVSDDDQETSPVTLRVLPSV